MYFVFKVLPLPKLLINAPEMDVQVLLQRWPDCLLAIKERWVRWQPHLVKVFINIVKYPCMMRKMVIHHKERFARKVESLYLLSQSWEKFQNSRNVSASPSHQLHSVKDIAHCSIDRDWADMFSLLYDWNSINIIHPCFLQVTYIPKIVSCFIEENDRLSVH